MKDTKTTNEKNNNRPLLILIAVLILISILVTLLRGCENIIPGYGSNNDTVTPSENTGIIYDDGATEGGWEQADMETILEGLNEKVEEGMINISINTSPYFNSGSDAGNLMIVNETINRYPQVVEIRRNDTDELIYKSGAIPVGSKIESAKLNTSLSKGVYECTAMFYNVDPDTGSYIGCAGAIITITINN